MAVQGAAYDLGNHGGGEGEVCGERVVAGVVPVLPGLPVPSAVGVFRDPGTFPCLYRAFQASLDPVHRVREVREGGEDLHESRRWEWPKTRSRRKHLRPNRPRIQLLRRRRPNLRLRRRRFRQCRVRRRRWEKPRTRQERKGQHACMVAFRSMQKVTHNLLEFFLRSRRHRCRNAFAFRPALGRSRLARTVLKGRVQRFGTRVFVSLFKTVVKVGHDHIVGQVVAVFFAGEAVIVFSDRVGQEGENHAAYKECTERRPSCEQATQASKHTRNFAPYSPTRGASKK